MPQAFDPSKPFTVADFDPSKPFTPVADQPHPEAKMSAAADGRSGVAMPGDPDEVTLGQLIDHPIESIKKIGATVGKEVSDPKLWASIALGYFGPKAADIVVPAMANAARAVGSGVASAREYVPDAIGVISPRAGKVIDIAQRFARARDAATVTQAPEPAAPVEAAPAQLQSTETPLELTRRLRAEWQAKHAQTAPAPAPASPAADPAPPQAAAPVASPAPASPAAASVAAAAPASNIGAAYQAVLKAFEDAGATPQRAEAANAVNLLKWGKSPAEAVSTVMGNRPGGTAAAPAVDPAAELARRLGTPSDAQVAADMEKRAVKGQKTLMPKYAADVPPVPKTLAEVAPTAEAASPSMPDYAGTHRPTPDGPPAHDLLEGDFAPKDIYEHPEWYVGDPGSAGARESVAALKKIRGKPDATVTIYRAAPKAELNSGDWVSLSKKYAAQHGMANDPSADVPVHAFKVKASDVKWAGDDLGEFGYYPSKGSPLETVGYEDVPKSSRRTVELSPTEQYALHWVKQDMESLPFTKHTFNETLHRGSDFDIVPGSGGAPIYQEIIGDVSGASRGDVLNAIRNLQQGKVTKLGELVLAKVKEVADMSEAQLKKRFVTSPPHFSEVGK